MSQNPKPQGEAEDRYTVPALERGLMLLSQFTRHQRSLSAPELAKRLELPRTTVFRMLSTLENLGFVEKTESGRDYRLGVAVLRLGFEYLASLELTELGRPLLERLCAEIRLPCNLVIRDAREIIYVAKITPPGAFTTAVTVGTRLPAHATVLGHVLLSALSMTELEHLYPEGTLTAFTERTPTNVQALFQMCTETRERGYVISEGFFESGISTIAAPVHDHAGRIVAALGSTVMSSHFDADRIAPIVEQVQASARELSSLLGHSHPTQDIAAQVISQAARTA